MRNIKFSEALLEATDQLLEAHNDVYVIGLGAGDPKGIFGTTSGLQAKYGLQRVMDMPASENAMTGIAVGSAIVGMRPLMTHQRADFFLLALDQLVNNAAKWHFMFGDQMKVPLTIRLIMGRGWGQGPQHSQTLHSIFAHIPGLKVVAPATPYDAKGLLVSAVLDDNPVIYMEHRWLHPLKGQVPQDLYSVPLGKANVMRKGTDVTLIASSLMSIDAFKAALLLQEEAISAEVIDLRTLKPLDEETLLMSVHKTGRVLIADQDWKTCGFAAELSALIAEKAFEKLKAPITRITFPDQICPTSWHSANHFYPRATDLAIGVLNMMGKQARSRKLLDALVEAKLNKPHDVPDLEFIGPF